MITAKQAYMISCNHGHLRLQEIENLILDAAEKGRTGVIYEWFNGSGPSLSEIKEELRSRGYEMNYLENPNRYNDPNVYFCNIKYYISWDSN